MRRLILAGNWKMYKTVSEAIELVNGLKRQLYDVVNLDIVVCPSFTSLATVSELIVDSNIRLGAQDVYWKEEGAFTGEISPSMLKDLGCKFVIVGHSERRQYFFETNESVNKKINAILNIGLIPIFCVGETLAQREENKTLEVIKEQLQKGLRDIVLEKAENLIVAYEPIWAIGTGKNATAEQAEEIQIYIRNLLAKMYNKDIAESVRIQYGGSVKPENIKELIMQPNIDGALIGGASLKIDSFSEIVKICSEARK